MKYYDLRNIPFNTRKHHSTRKKERTKRMLKRKLPIMLLTIGMLILLAAFMIPYGRAETAIIWTDKTDYTPSETVTIFGSGFLVNSVIDVQVTRPDSTVDSWNNVTSDAAGNFTTTYQLDGITGTYNVTATDGTNPTATTTFTDTYHISTVSVGAQSPASVQPGSTATFAISSTWGGSGTSPTATLSITNWSPSTPTSLTITFTPATISQSSSSSTLTIATSTSTSSGTYTFTVEAFEDNGHKPTATGTLVVQADNTPPSSSAGPLPTYETSLTFSVPYTASDNVGGSGVKNVQLWFRVGGSGSYSQYGTVFTSSPISFTASGNGY